MASIPKPVAFTSHFFLRVLVAVGKVYPFKPRPSRPSPSGGNRGWRWGRLTCLMVYGAVGWKFPALQNSAFTLMMLLGLAYWALVHHRRISTAYETRFHLLQALLLMVFSSVTFQIVGALLNTITSALLLFSINDGVLTLLAQGIAWLPQVARVTLIAFSMFGVFSIAKGRATPLPWLGSPARYWA